MNNSSILLISYNRIKAKSLIIFLLTSEFFQFIGNSYLIMFFLAHNLIQPVKPFHHSSPITDMSLAETFQLSFILDSLHQDGDILRFFYF